MLTPTLFFLMAFATFSALLWTGFQLFRDQEDPLGDRLEELQSRALVTSARVPRRRGGGFLNTFLYFVSMFPGGEDWLRGTEKELAQAGIRRKQALALYALGHISFMLAILAAMFYFQQDNPLINRLGGMAAAAILGWLVPPQILHRLVRRYRKKLQEALPDTVDLLGIVLGTGLALDQAMMRVSEELEYIYPELAAEFYTVVMPVKPARSAPRLSRNW